MFILDLLNIFLYWSVMGDKCLFAYKYTQNIIGRDVDSHGKSEFFERNKKIPWVH